MKIFVVIPAWNEAKRIRQVLQSLISLPYEVVVVDDASTDETAEIVREFPVYLLRHRLNRDQGAALQTGNDFALSHGADVIVHFDADGQFLVEEIKDLAQPVIDGVCDVVFGSRFLEKKSKMPWFKKNIMFPIARLVNRILLGIKLTDPQSGFRVLSRQVAEAIIIEQDGKAHCSEIAAKVFEHKFKVKEVPMTVIYHEFGQGLSGGIKIVKDLIFSKLLK
ncbi:glycosyltransferase family 2 protein [Candidatus Parcubacteria bacterium]|jgi:polyprenyl-phospho-N-acetylgalactosaminyl synthase|nr:glycosyltransferase family 2 protein [Candidatus Parcubacteria bacterium]